MSVLRAVRKRKKVRKLGSVNIIHREAYADLELDAKVELIRPLVPLGLMHVQALLDQEVTALASDARSRSAVDAAAHAGLAGPLDNGARRRPDAVASRGLRWRAIRAYVAAIGRPAARQTQQVRVGRWTPSRQ